MWNETGILFSFSGPHPSPRPSPRSRGEGEDLERDREPRVPLTLHPGLQIFRPWSGLGKTVNYSDFLPLAVREGESMKIFPITKDNKADLR